MNTSDRNRYKDKDKGKDKDNISKINIDEYEKNIWKGKYIICPDSIPYTLYIIIKKII